MVNPLYVVHQMASNSLKESAYFLLREEGGEVVLYSWQFVKNIVKRKFASGLGPPDDVDPLYDTSHPVWAKKLIAHKSWLEIVTNGTLGVWRKVEVEKEVDGKMRMTFENERVMRVILPANTISRFVFPENIPENVKSILFYRDGTYIVTTEG